MTQELLTPSAELVTSLRNSAPHGIRDAGVTREHWLIEHAYAAGADQRGAVNEAELQKSRDQELEACCKWLVCNYNYPEAGNPLRTARRPKPPSLKEQALKQLESLEKLAEACGHDSDDTIRRALEALPND